MKKRSLVCGLIPALTLGICSTGFAESAPEAAPAAEAPVTAVEGYTTEESLQELRERLEAKLQSTKELKARLNAKIDDLDKRIMTEQRKHWTPKYQMWGYARLRRDAYNFEGYKGINNSYIRLNLYSTYHIDDNWMIRNESEFDNNLSDNTGSYNTANPHPTDDFFFDKDGKTYDRKILQLFAEGRIGEFNVKVGRYFLESPYKFMLDEKVDGVHIAWGKHVKYGDARFTFSAGNMYTGSTFGETDLSMGSPNYRKGDESQRHKLLALTAQVPVAKNTNMVATLANLKHRDQSDFNRNTVALGFDTQITRELKFRAASSKSTSKTFNRSHYMQLQYKQVEPAIPGSFDIYLRKYLMRGHGGVTKWFMDDIPNGPAGFADEIKQKNPGAPDPSAEDAERPAEFNGLAIGFEYVPVRNTKLKLDYTFGDYGLFNWKTGEGTGNKKKVSVFTAQWEFYF